MSREPAAVPAIRNQSADHSSFAVALPTEHTSMSASKLMRFLDPHKGPVVSLVSAPYPSFWSRKLWHSSAILHPSIQSSLSTNTTILKSCGSGWSSDKQESQSKAITEAVERWALSTYSQWPQKAALDIDPTSTGFSALPCSFSRDESRAISYCEALERWALNSIWDNADIPLERTSLSDEVLLGLFRNLQGQVHLYRTEFVDTKLTPRSTFKTNFYFCLFETSAGGVIPGSACGVDAAATARRAALEAFTHARAYFCLKKLPDGEISNILEKRLLHFGDLKHGFVEISKRLSAGTASTVKSTPDIIFSGELAGPWNPEIFVYRIVLRGSPAFLSGGIERFVI